VVRLAFKGSRAVSEVARELEVRPDLTAWFRVGTDQVGRLHVRQEIATIRTSQLGAEE
jgi:hypothetical protein